MDLKATPSNVNDSFLMLVPICLELADGNMFALGRAKLAGNSSIEQKMPLSGLKVKPRRAVLAAPN